MNKYQKYLIEVVFRKLILTPPQRFILIILGGSMKTVGTKISWSQISKITGYHISTVGRIIKELKFLNIISAKSSVRSDGSTSLNTYQFVGMTLSQRDTPPIAQNDSNIYNNNNIYKLNNKWEYSENFLQIYSLFPSFKSRTDKKKAFLIFQKIKLDFKLILKATENRIKVYQIENPDFNERGYQYLESLQRFLAKDLFQFLTKEDSPKGELVITDRKQNPNPFIKGTNLIDPTALIKDLNKKEENVTNIIEHKSVF